MENIPGHCAHLCLSAYITDLGFKLNSLRIPTLCLEDKHKVSQIQTDKESLALRKTTPGANVPLSSQLSGR